MWEHVRKLDRQIHDAKASFCILANGTVVEKKLESNEVLCIAFSVGKGMYTVSQKKFPPLNSP